MILYHRKRRITVLKVVVTVRETAQRLGTAESSVRLWVRNGRFPGAELIRTPAGSYWMIPDTALKGFSMGKAGRPPKTAKDARDE